MLEVLVKYSKKCIQCSHTITYNNKYNYERSIKDNSLCRSCACINRNKTKDHSVKSNNGCWKDYKDIPYSWFSKYFIRKKSKNKKKRTGTITIEDVYNIWIKQEKVCNLSGIPIGFCDDGLGHTCSIDRIDSNKEYDLDNIQLVHKDINYMKNRYNNDYFIDICKKIALRN